MSLVTAIKALALQWYSQFGINANDEMTTPANGTLVGDAASVVDDVFGHAIELYGAGSISIGAPAKLHDINRTLTFSIFFKPSRAVATSETQKLMSVETGAWGEGGAMYLLKAGDEAADSPLPALILAGWGYGFETIGGGYAFDRPQKSGLSFQQNSRRSGYLQTGRWSMLTWTSDAATGIDCLYINGELVGKRPNQGFGIGHYSAATKTYKIGCNASTGASPAVGCFAHPFIGDRAITAAEVASIWAASPVPQYPTPSQLYFWGTGLLASFCFGITSGNGSDYGMANATTLINKNLFNPTALNFDQWIAPLAACGCKAAFLTTRHVDGFCIWNTATTTRQAANSAPWGAANAGRDLVAEFCATCRRYGILPCLYLSVRDMQLDLDAGKTLNDLNTGAGLEATTAAYWTRISAQITELLGGAYGTIAALWLDPACSSAGGASLTVAGRTRALYEHAAALVKTLSPTTLFFINGGKSLVFGDLGYWEQTAPGTRFSAMTAVSGTFAVGQLVYQVQVASTNVNSELIATGIVESWEAGSKTLVLNQIGHCPFDSSGSYPITDGTNSATPAPTHPGNDDRIPGVACMTIDAGGYWFYQNVGSVWRSAATVYQTYRRMLQRGSSFQINLSPAANGLVPQGQIDALAGMRGYTLSQPRGLIIGG